MCPADRCIQTCLPIADALSLPLYVEFGLSEWYSPVTPGTGLHPRPAPADDLQRYFPRPSHGSATTETKITTTTTTTTTAATTATTTAPDMDVDRNANTNGSYIDPRWTPTYLVTRKGESVAELYARCEEFLRAFLGRVEGRRPSLSPSPAPSSPSPSSSALVPAPSADDGQHRQHGAGVGVGVGVGHARVLLVSHAATVIALARALTGDAGLAGGMRVGCCTLTTLERTGVPAAALPPTPAAGAPGLFSSRDVIGRGEWTVRGVPADGAFLAGGAERCWGMADIETHVGVVVEDDGVPGSEDEEDGPNGVQVWWQQQTGAPRSRM